jgi:hypothetical protein
MNRFTAALVVFVAALLTLGADGCDNPNSEGKANQVQREQTSEMTNEAHKKVGMPDIQNFTERRLLKRIMELRDQSFSTHSYIVNREGDMRKLCESIGYGLPYGVQFVNPEKTVDGQWKGEYTTIPQADPNGLYSPPNVDATWVNCVTTSGNQKPVYSEERVITSPVPLDQLKGNETR